MSVNHKNNITLSADIGGTFTDLVLEGSFTRLTRKVLTTVGRPEVGLMNGAQEVLDQAGLAFSDVDTFIHGTTLATNALLERKGARTALVTTAGFRDVLEIGTESRFDQYDIQLTKPIPLVSRELRLVVNERMDAAGRVICPLNIADVEEVIADLRREQIESVAITYLHAYANAAHEQQTAELVAQAIPSISISVSSEVCPEIREFERVSTTVANAYVKPLVDGYLGRMTDALAAAGFDGRLFLISSGGSLTSVDTARRFPIRLVESGPAGGAIYASGRARELGLDKVLSFDMGGTTAKVCLIQDGKPTTASTFEVDRTHRFMKGSGIPLRIPSVELVEIGAGGGSIAGIDRMGRVTVGPESAGSDPGPACYPSGGDRATVTDAALALGLLDANNFAGGRIVLDSDRAADALDRVVGSSISSSPQMAAYAVYQTVCENMASAVRVHAAERGEPISDYSMIAFGGAAPLHAAAVAEKVGISRVIVPTNAGVGSAVGFLEAPVSFELVRSLHMALSAFDSSKMCSLLDAMSTEARGILSRSGDAVVIERRIAFMRYVGQGHEIGVELPENCDTLTAGGLRMAFETQYAELFSRIIPNAAIEILTWSVLVTAEDNVPAGTRNRHVDRSGEAGVRRIYDGNRAAWIDVPVYARSELGSDVTIQGPAIVVEAETSTFISQAFTASIDRSGYIVMQRKAA